jgi:hypothetical protein
MSTIFEALNELKAVHGNKVDALAAAVEPAITARRAFAVVELAKAVQEAKRKGCPDAEIMKAINNTFLIEEGTDKC